VKNFQHIGTLEREREKETVPIEFVAFNLSSNACCSDVQWTDFLKVLAPCNEEEHRKWKF
jgi:hypothetical protein